MAILTVQVFLTAYKNSSSSHKIEGSFATEAVAEAFAHRVAGSVASAVSVSVESGDPVVPRAPGATDPSAPPEGAAFVTSPSADSVILVQACTDSFAESPKFDHQYVAMVL